MGFSRQEYQSGISSPGNLPNPGIKPRSPALQADSLLTRLPGLLRDMQNLTYSETQCRDSNLKEPGSDPLTDLGEAPRVARTSKDSPWGHRCWQQLFLRAHFTTVTLGLASTTLESFSSLLAPRASILTSRSTPDLGPSGLKGQQHKN